MCTTNLNATFPRWRINDNVYDVTNLPPRFSATGFLFETRVEVQWYSLKKPFLKSAAILLLLFQVIQREVRNVTSFKTDKDLEMISSYVLGHCTVMSVSDSCIYTEETSI